LEIKYEISKFLSRKRAKKNQAKTKPFEPVFYIKQRNTLILVLVPECGFGGKKGWE
jgi:hypothetical protein